MRPILFFVALMSVSFAADNGFCNKAKAKKQLDLGLKLYREGKYQPAADAFSKSYNADKNYETLYNLARTETELKQYKAAIAHLEQYLKEGGEKIPVGMRDIVQKEIERLGFILSQQSGQSPGATSQPQEPTVQPTSGQGASGQGEATALYKKGQALYAKGNLQEAALQFDKSYRIYPYPECLYYLGKIASKLNQRDRAMMLFDRYLKEGGNRISPALRKDVAGEREKLAAASAHAEQKGSSDQFFKEGKEWLTSGDPKRASALFDQAYRASPNPDILYYLAQAMEQLKQYGPAKAAYERYLNEAKDGVSNKRKKEVQGEINRLSQLEADAANRKEALSHYNKGLALNKKERYQEALGSFEQALRLYQNQETLLGIAEANAGLGRNQAAIDTYRRYLKAGGKKLPPEERERVEREVAWLEAVTEAHTLYDNADYKGALKAFETANELKPQFELLYYIGKISTRMEYNDRAVDAYQQYFALGGNRVSQGRRSEVKSEIERLSGLIKAAARKEEARMIFEDARQEMKNGEFEFAVDNLKKSYKLHANYEVYYFLGQAYDRLRKYTKGRESYERYLRDGATAIANKRRKEVDGEIMRLKDLEKAAADRKKAVAYYKKGLKLNKRKNYVAAMAEFERAYKLHSDYRILGGIAKSATGQKRYELAISAHQRYLDEGGPKVSPEKRISVEVEIEQLQQKYEQEQKKQQALEQYKEAQLLSKQGAHKNALKAFNKAYDIYPNYKIIFNIAKTEAYLKKYEDAIYSYNRYLEAGGSQVSDKQRAKTKKEVERIKKAIQTLEDEKKSQDLFKSGRKAKARKKWQEAIDAFEEAYKLDTNYEILLPLAECYAKQKEHKKAIENYNTYLSKGGARISEKKRKKIKKETDRLYNLVNKK
ncbi:MAG: tetratricopeptide repeat protein [Myxococcota bacterium]|nr:tetratricopeptide repeat protein [Myxococcota bacterium]